LFSADLSANSAALPGHWFPIIYSFEPALRPSRPWCAGFWPVMQYPTISGIAGMSSFSEPLQIHFIPEYWQPLLKWIMYTLHCKLEVVMSNLKKNRFILMKKAIGR
jgi:hypothetical protein